jgi:hypothetical protein
MVYVAGSKVGAVTMFDRYLMNAAGVEVGCIDRDQLAELTVDADSTLHAERGVEVRIDTEDGWHRRAGVADAPLLATQSGTPYNLTIGNDLTGNNQFNARPTYGTCGTADKVIGAMNLFNIVNRGTPNGVLNSPLFGTSQTLASGQFGQPALGNGTSSCRPFSTSSAHAKPIIHFDGLTQKDCGVSS